MSAEVLIAGAGPAGCATAIALRRLGVPVLLVDRARFPRPKACGCCLGPASIAELRLLGLEPLAQDDALSLCRLRLHAGTATAEMALHEGVVMSREGLDLRLLQLAEAHGARVLTGTRVQLGATVSGGREVVLSGAMRTRTRAALVILATGLPVDVPATPRMHPAARIGLAQSASSRSGPPPGAVVMVASPGGYVGLVRLADGRLNVAASVSASALRSAASPAAAVDDILVASGQRPLGWRGGWRGTPALRHVQLRHQGAHVLSVGDAAGFWEPFTGEGIGWALQGGRLVAAPAARLVERWDEAVACEWWAAQRRWLGAAQRRSRLVAGIAARPRLAAALIGALHLAPSITGRLLAGRELGRAPA